MNSVTSPTPLPPPPHINRILYISFPSDLILELLVESRSGMTDLVVVDRPWPIGLLGGMSVCLLGVMPSSLLLLGKLARRFEFILISEMQNRLNTSVIIIMLSIEELLK